MKEKFKTDKEYIKKRYLFDYERDLLGRGTFGSVYKAIDLEKNNELVAIKIISKNTLESFDNEIKNNKIKDIKLEVKLLKLCENEYSVKLLDFIETNSHFYIVMEYCHSNLKKFLYDIRKGCLSLSEVRTLFNKINISLKKMKENNIIHQNLKPENILLKLDIEKGIIPKICDYVIGEEIQKENISSFSNTISYKSPEPNDVKKEIAGKMNNESYLWSIGVILYEIYFGQMLMDDKTAPNIWENFLRFAPVKSGDKKFDDLLIGLLQENPEKRLSFEDYIQHEFWKDDNREKIIKEALISLQKRMEAQIEESKNNINLYQNQSGNSKIKIQILENDSVLKSQKNKKYQQQTQTKKKIGHLNRVVNPLKEMDQNTFRKSQELTSKNEEESQIIEQKNHKYVQKQYTLSNQEKRNSSKKIGKPTKEAEIIQQNIFTKENEDKNYNGDTFINIYKTNSSKNSNNNKRKDNSPLENERREAENPNKNLKEKRSNNYINFQKEPKNLKFIQDILSTNIISGWNDIFEVFISFKNKKGYLVTPGKENINLDIITLLDNQLILSLKGHNNRIRTIRYFINNNFNEYLISADDNKIVIIFDITNNYNILYKINTKYEFWIYSCLLLFNQINNNSYIITSSCYKSKNFDNSSTKIYSLATGEFLNYITNSNTIAIYYLLEWFNKRNNKYYLIQIGFNKILINNLLEEELYSEINNELDIQHVSGFIFNKNENDYLCFSSFNGIISIYNLFNKKIERVINTNGGKLVHIIQWNIKYLITADQNNKSFKIIDLEEGQVTGEIKDVHSKDVICIKKIYHPIYGESIISAGKDNFIKLWSI